MRKCLVGGKLPDGCAHSRYPFCPHAVMDEPLTNGPTLSKSVQSLRRQRRLAVFIHGMGRM